MPDDLRFRLRALFRRGDVEDDLDDELRSIFERAPSGTWPVRPRSMTLPVLPMD